MFLMMFYGWNHLQPCCLKAEEKNMGVILEEDQRVLEIMTSNVVRDNLKTAR